MTPMRGARKTEKELRTVTKVAALSLLKSVNALELIEMQLTNKLVSKLAKSLQICGGKSERAYLPRLYHPSGGECNDCAPANIDVPRENTSQVNATSNSVSTNVLEENGECEGEGQEKDASSRR